jgi:gliding motility-associated-like protein/uncharacterized repeat protein (TIGR01451 family)
MYSGNGSVVLSGLPAGNWTINPGAVTGSTASTTISGLAEGTYNFTVTNEDGCTSLASADVVINEQPETPVAPIVGLITQPTCILATGSVVLSGLPAGNWTINPGAVTGSTASTTISGLAEGTYNFTVTNEDGCTSLASADVVINEQPETPVAPIVGLITQPTCILATGSVVLSGLPAGNWTINPGAVTGSTASTTISGLAEGTYNFTVTNEDGCTSLASADVVINEQPETPLAPIVGLITQPTCILATGSVVLSGLPAGNWTINPGAVTGSTASTTISGLAEGTYNFTVTNEDGCTSLASADVVINEQPETPLAIAGSNSPIITGNSIYLTAQTVPGGTYTWTGPNGYTSSVQNPIILSASAANAGLYSLTIMANGCTSLPSTVSVVVNSNSTDLSIIKTVDNTYPMIGRTIVFTIVATNNGPISATGVTVSDIMESGYTYVSSTTTTGNYVSSTGVWTIGNMPVGASETLTITVTVNPTGSYVSTVTIVGNEPDGDTGNNTSTIVTYLTDFFIPEGFSPNGDAINDLFVIRGILYYPENSIMIFNRWGNKVFEANPYQNTWDGRSSIGIRVGGDELPSGTYFYILNLGDGSPVIKGTIYLNR